MKISDLLRNLADKMDSGSSDSNDNIEQDTDNDHSLDGVGTMVPPLQQKIELIKKSTGIDNIYDNPDKNDDIEQLKKMAGITQHQNQTIGDDEESD